MVHLVLLQRLALLLVLHLRMSKGALGWSVGTHVPGLGSAVCACSLESSGAASCPPTPATACVAMCGSFGICDI
jgi:hypothetical protein